MSELVSRLNTSFSDIMSLYSSSTLISGEADNRTENVGTEFSAAAVESGDPIGADGPSAIRLAADSESYNQQYNKILQSLATTQSVRSQVRNRSHL